MREKTPLTQSKFAMWRAAVALAHADKNLSPEEEGLIHDYLSHASLTEEQQKILETDIKNGITLDSILPEITETKDRAHLINFARVLFHIDGEFCDAEKEILEKLNQYHQSTLNLNEAFASARDEVDSFDEKEQLRMSREKKSQSFFENAFEFLTRKDV